MYHPNHYSKLVYSYSDALLSPKARARIVFSKTKALEKSKCNHLALINFYAAVEKFYSRKPRMSLSQLSPL